MLKFPVNFQKSMQIFKMSSQKLQSASFCARLSKELYNAEIQGLEVGLYIDLVR